MDDGRVIAGLLAILGACSSPSLVEDPPRECAVSSDCILRPASCCGTCGEATQDDAVAIAADRADDYRAAACGAEECYACGLSGTAPYAVGCRDSLCTLVDYRGDAGGVVPSCDDPVRGVAWPPVRLVRTARALEELGAHVTVQSIGQCDDGHRAPHLVRAPLS